MCHIPDDSLLHVLFDHIQDDSLLYVLFDHIADELLPMVHEVWSPFCQRFSDEEKLVIKKVLKWTYNHMVQNNCITWDPWDLEHSPDNHNKVIYDKINPF